jgi:uncharacterized protein
MAESDEPHSAGPPSAVLMALYMGDRDKAHTLAAMLQLTLPELAAFGDLDPVSAQLHASPTSVADRSGDGWTALHLAGFFGYAGVCTLLLRAGASHAERATNAQGNTALHAAIAGRCEYDAIAVLLAGGSDPNAIDAQGYAPIHLAGSRGAQQVIALLLACGADAALRTREGKRAADIATERGHPEAAAQLVRAERLA